MNREKEITPRHKLDGVSLYLYCNSLVLFALKAIPIGSLFREKKHIKAPPTMLYCQIVWVYNSQTRRRSSERKNAGKHKFNQILFYFYPSFVSL